MTSKKLIGAGLAGLGALAIAVLLCDPTLAQTAAPAAAEPAAAPALVINKGDNAWMMTSTVLVLLMTIPGLALFYAGMVRPKNALSVLTHVFYTVCVVTLIWVIYGYSLAFTGG
jgi:Amt family ammonium transporter